MPKTFLQKSKHFATRPCWAQTSKRFQNAVYNSILTDFLPSDFLTPFFNKAGFMG